MPPRVLFVASLAAPLARGWQMPPCLSFDGHGAARPATEDLPVAADGDDFRPPKAYPKQAPATIGGAAAQ